jgi:ABC-2 type transport system permease protein
VSLFAAELLKVRTTRVPYVLFALTAVACALVAAALVGAGEVDADDEDRALALAQAAAFWSVLATVLGILVVTNEYRHGTITSTFLSEPRRTRILAAKLATALVAGGLLAVCAFAAVLVVAVPWLAVTDQALSLEVQILEALGRLVLAFALSAALGTAVGAVIQSQVGTIIAVFVWFLIAESIVGVVSSLLLGDFGEPDPVTPYLPGTVLGGIVGGGQGGEFMLRAAPSIALAFGYVAVLAFLGALAMERRDP